MILRVLFQPSQRGQRLFALAAVELKFSLCQQDGVRGFGRLLVSEPQPLVATIVATLQVRRAGRLQIVEGLRGATVFDDSYNANPVSVIAAGEYLASLAGQNWVVFGDMKELGEDEQQLHLEVGRALKKAGIKRLFATGELGRDTVAAFGDGASWFEAVDELAETVLKELTGNVNVLVKGSRSMRMERVVDKLRAPEAMRKEA